jgi:SAM-dependent methyltransferase
VAFGAARLKGRAVTDAGTHLTEQDAERILRGTEYWHYPFDLPWGRVAPTKPGTEHRHEQRRRHFFEPLIERHGGSLAGKRMLDLGCCQGYWSFEAARAGAASCLGIDSSPTFVAEARALRTLYGIDACDFRQAHLEDDPWWSGLAPFDVTLFLGLFYHLADPTFVLRRAMALTRETIVVDTVVQQRDEALLVILPRDLDEPSTSGSGLVTKIRVLPTPAALRALLEDGGFTATEVLPIRGAMPRDYTEGRRMTLIARR